jgi:endoglucanase
LWETNPTTPVKLDDVYASLPAFETETQSVNADTADDVNDAEDTFADLLPDCIYNVYGFNQEYMELSDDGLGYVNQFVTDSNGSLPFDKASVEGSESLYWKAVPMTRLSIADAQVEIAELKYNGEEQDIDPIVTLNGKTLVRNADYFVAEGESFTSAGEYTGLICGMGIYKGELEFTYTVTGGKLGDVNGDNKINITDVTLVAAHIKGKRMLAADKIIYADINKDGKINITDVTKIAAHIKGKKLIS